VPSSVDRMEESKSLLREYFAMVQDCDQLWRGATAPNDNGLTVHIPKMPDEDVLNNMTAEEFSRMLEKMAGLLDEFIRLLDSVGLMRAKRA
jgi:hypothetical protein